MGACSSKEWSSDIRLDGKTVVVTGCNTGIGRICVEDFYTRGARVIMACRNVGKAEKTKEDIIDHVEAQAEVGRIIVRQLDLSSLKSVRKCAQQILQEEDRIDVLLNNAGVGMGPKEKTADGFEMVFGTNHLGHFLFTLLLLARLKQTPSPPARIVNVASKAYVIANMDFEDINWERKSYASLAAYAQSKLANILFTMELSRRLQGQNVHTYALHPGAVKTDIFRNFNTMYFNGAEWMATTCCGCFLKTPYQGALTSIYCCVDQTVAQDTGLYYADCKLEAIDKNRAKLEDAKRLWDISAQLVDLDDAHNLPAPT